MNDNNDSKTEAPAIELAITTGQQARVGVGVGRRMQLTARGIVFNGKMTFEQWREALVMLRQVKDRYHIYLADVLGYGRANFGEARVEEALGQLEFDYAECAKAMHIGQIELNLRLPELNAEHFCVLGMELKDDPKAQAKWVKLAVQHALTPLELRKSIQAGGVIKQDKVNALSGRDAGISTIEGVRFSFDRWEKQVGGESAVLGWTPEIKKQWLIQVEPIVELAGKVRATLAGE
jgi:hypothetical protein